MIALLLGLSALAAPRGVVRDAPAPPALEAAHAARRVALVVGLDGYDDPQEPWDFPAGLELEPGGFLVVYCDQNVDSDDGELQASFRLSRQDGIIMLTDATRGGASLVDLVEYGYQTTDVSTARYPDGHDHWYQSSEPTPGESNPL